MNNKGNKMQPFTLEDIKESIEEASIVFKRTRNYGLLKYALEHIQLLSERISNLYIKLNESVQWQFWLGRQPSLDGNIVGVYKDGSGAILCKCKDGKMYNTDGDLLDEAYFDESIFYWAYLPDNVTLWNENTKCKGRTSTTSNTLSTLGK